MPKPDDWPELPRLLITDFDGTLTRIDFYECVLAERESPTTSTVWDRFLAGEATHFEALRAIFADLPADEESVMRIARRTQLEPDLAPAVERLRRAGWGVLVVSAGCDWYISRLLRERGVELPVIANPGRLAPGRGLELLAPTTSPFYDPETGIDKRAVVEAALGEYEQVAFAGNGRADLAAARRVAPELRFATGWLAEQLAAAGERFRAFGRWRDVAEELVRE